MSVSSDLWTLLWNTLCGRQSNDADSDINTTWRSSSPFRTMHVLLVRAYRSSDLIPHDSGTWTALLVSNMFDELNKHTEEEIRIMFLDWMRRAARNVPRENLFLSAIRIQHVSPRSMWIRYEFLDPWPTYASSSTPREMRLALRTMILIFRRIFPKDILRMLADYIAKCWPTPCSLMNRSSVMCEGGYVQLEQTKCRCDAVICRAHYEKLDPRWECCRGKVPKWRK